MPKVEQCLEISPVWSGHPVGFCLLTEGKRQYVAYYDWQRRMTVAARALGEGAWSYYRIPSRQNEPPKYKTAITSTILGWDSHNSIAMTIDAADCIHLSGNMHCNALTYFATTRPRDISSFEQLEKMTGQSEESCTYPCFLKGAGGELIFHYRDGSSGCGNEIFNVYNLESKTWRRLLDQPLTDGQNRMNAYIIGPVRGPDRCFHISWVWRDTFDCSTNHDLSYGRSRDLVHWETAMGEALGLPMTVETNGVVVDPVPAAGGLLNGCGKLGFDAQKRPILAYHKFDDRGLTQAYCARLEGDGWKICQVSDWNYRWHFSGGGSIVREIDIGQVVPGRDGHLELSYDHKEHGSGTWRLDEHTLRPIATTKKTMPWPEELEQVESDFPGMEVRWVGDSGEGDDPEAKYFLRWETLPPNRDGSREKTIPKPSMLRVYKLARATT